MTQIEIYKWACDGLAGAIEHLKHRCALRYGKAGYENLCKVLEARQADYKWLCNERDKLEANKHE